MENLESTHAMHSYKKVNTLDKPNTFSEKEIIRHALIEKIFLALQHKQVVWLSSPAGYGKSIIMRQVLQRSSTMGFQAEWISADKEAHFFKKFFFDLKKSKPSLFFLDHPSSQNLQIFLETLNSCFNNKKILLASRKLPQACGYKTFRPNHLKFFGISQLKFSLLETQFFLQKIAKLAIQDNEASTLFHKTGGWPVALQSFSLAIEQEENLSLQAFIDEFSGSYHELQNYFSEVVMTKLRAKEQELLKCCSVFKSFDEALVKNLSLGKVPSLKNFYHRGFFLKKHTQHKGHFSFFPLFQQYLQSQLSFIQWEQILRQAAPWLSQFPQPQTWVADYLGIDKLSPSMNENLLKGNQNTNNQQAAGPILTPREKELMTELKSDIPLGQVAQKLFISKNTLKTHLRKLYKKFNVKNRAGLLVKLKEESSDSNKNK